MCEQLYGVTILVAINPLIYHGSAPVSPRFHVQLTISESFLDKQGHLSKHSCIINFKSKPLLWVCHKSFSVGIDQVDTGETKNYRCTSHLIKSKSLLVTDTGEN